MPDQMPAGGAEWAQGFTNVSIVPVSQPTPEAAPAATGQKFSLSVPGIPPLKSKACGGRVDIEVVPVIKITGVAALDPSDSTNIDAKGIAEACAAAALKAALGWYHSKAETEVVSGNLFTNLKVGKDGTSIAASSSTSTPMGNFTLKVVFIGIEGKVQKTASAKTTVKVLSAEAELIGARTKVPDTEVDGVVLTKLVIESGAKVTMGPNWADIVAQWAFETAGEEIAADAGAGLGEAAVVVVSLEGILVVGGVAAIGASIYGLVSAWGIGDLAQSYRPSLDSARAGFKAAMACASAPSDAYGKAGYQVGQQNYQAVFAQAKSKNPQASEDAITAAIVAKADEALAQVAETIDHNVRVGLWHGYLAQHTSFLTSGDAKWAFVACFGDLPKDSDPEWKNYVSQHPKSSML